MKKYFLFLLILSVFYLVRKNVTFHATIKHENHTKIFQYVSDVSKFRQLNPTIINITRYEQMDETSFYVEYTEYLSQIPVVRNQARAFYEIRHRVGASHGLFSRHSTCFFMNLFCLSTDSSLHVTKLSKSKVGYREQIFYSCPWALEWFCFNEIAFQRKKIVYKLQEIFSNGKNEYP